MDGNGDRRMEKQVECWVRIRRNEGRDINEDRKIVCVNSIV